MLPIHFYQLKPSTDVLAGAALGEKHSHQIASIISAQRARADAAVVLDFRDIQAVTPSYLRQTLLPLYGSGSGEALPSRVLPLYSNLSPSTEDDLHHFLLAHRLPALVVRVKGRTTAFQKRLGWFEATANETLSRLSNIHAGSASDLMATAGGTAVALTAWNNRLAELFRLRLATREKRGRHWIYKPIVEVKNNG